MAEQPKEILPQKEQLEISKKPLTLQEDGGRDQTQNRINDAVNVLEGRLNETQIIAETDAALGVHKTEVGAGILDKAKEWGSKSLEWAKHNRGKLLLGSGAVYGAKKIWDYFKGEPQKVNEATASTKENTNAQHTTVIVEGSKASRWQRAFPWLVGTAGMAGAGYFFRDHLYKIPVVGPWIDSLIHPQISFETAMKSVEGNVINKAKESHLNRSPDLQRDVSKNTLTAYGYPFEIDLVSRKIQGIEDIRFSSYEELITMVVIIGATKKEFSGKCKSQTPFSITTAGGDIEIALTKESKDAISGAGIPVGAIAGGLTGATLGGLAGAYGLKSIQGTVAGIAAGGAGGAMAGSATLDHNDTLSQICPSLNNNRNKTILQGYLNGMGCWMAGDDNHLIEKARTNNKKLNTTFVNTFEKIKNTINPNDDQNESLGNNRQASINNHEGHPDIFQLKTRGYPCYLHTTMDANGNVGSVEIEDIGISFTGPNAIEGAIRLGSFINKCEAEKAGKGDQADAFSYSSRVGFQTAIYFDGDGEATDTRLLSEDALQQHIPTLLKNDNMDKFINWLNGRKGGGQSLWTNTTPQERQNTYLEEVGKK